jgi:hypothetical protein
MVIGMEKLLFDIWVQHNGMLEVIMSDQDVKFKLEFRTLLMKKARKKQKFNTTFHLQTNSKTEKVNGILNQYLCNYIVNNRKDWGDHLCLVEFCYNSTKHSTTKMNPFELTLGVETKQPMDLAIL